jgi:hypothetical protein
MDQLFDIVLGITIPAPRPSLSSSYIETAVQSIQLIPAKRLAKEFADVAALLLCNGLDLLSEIFRKADRKDSRGSGTRNAHKGSITYYGNCRNTSL